jgi:hypothetical protein
MDFHYFAVIGSFFFVYSAEHAFPVFPFVPDALEPDVSGVGIELRHGVIAVRSLGAIDAPAGKMRGQLRDGNAEELMLENMVDTFLQIRIDGFQPLQQTLGDLAQEDTALAGRIEERGIRIAE